MDKDTDDATHSSPMTVESDAKSVDLPVHEPWLETEEYDATHREWQKNNPGKPFSEFSAERVAKALENGHKHTTLGFILHNNQDWHRNGHPFYRKILDLSKIPMDAKVCDYGCGSLRVGVHFMKRQYAGCFMGLDVTEDFISYGRAAAANTIRKKRAKIGTIKKKLDEAIKFSPDMLFAANVVCHVHPEEVETFYSNIKAIVNRVGGEVILHVVENPEPIRYQRSGWAWPLSHFDDNMEGFLRTNTVFIKKSVKGVHTMGTYFLVYQRTQADFSSYKGVQGKVRKIIRTLTGRG